MKTDDSLMDGFLIAVLPLENGPVRHENKTDDSLMDGAGRCEAPIYHDGNHRKLFLGYDINFKADITQESLRQRIKFLSESFSTKVHQAPTFHSDRQLSIADMPQYVPHYNRVP